MIRAIRDVVRLGGVLCLCALASACGGGDTGDAAAPAQVTRSLGLMEVTISGLGTRSMESSARMLPSGEVAHAATAAAPTAVPMGLDVKQASASTVDAGGMRYFTVVYNVRNAQYCNKPGTCTAYTSASHNLTLVAANTSANINNTALTDIQLFDGSRSAATQALATSLLPTHGMEFNAAAGSGVLVAPGLASLQVYSENEVASASIPRDAGATDLFPFAYVVSNVHTPGSRSLPANPAANQWDGEVAFSFKIPLQSDSSQDPYSITMIFQVIDDANTRVTESQEEQNGAGDAAALLRATTLGSADVAVFGGRVAQLNGGDPVCTVRIAGTAAAPSAYLVNNGATNGGATLASAPYNLTGQSASGPFEFDFCAPMAVPAAGALVMSGSQSGAHAGTYTVSGNAMYFTPTTAFIPGEAVNYTLTTGVKSAAGTPLASAVTQRFAVGGKATVASSGTLALGSAPPAATAAYMVTAADFDGDGTTDVAVLNQSTHVVTIYPGNGGAAYAGATLGSATTWLVAGDFNGDGKPDLAAASTSAFFVALNNGGGSFGAASTTTPGVTGTLVGLVAADMNNDGHTDLVVTAESSSGATNNLVGLIYFGGAGGLPSTASATASAGATSGYVTVGVDIAVGDFNGDGKPDLAMLTLNGIKANLVILLNNGNGTAYTQATGSPVAFSTVLCSVVVADFNGDGKPDLAVTANGTGVLMTLLNDGSGNFSIAANHALASGAGSIATGDFDGDGNIDLAVGNLNNSTAWVLLNKDGTGKFSAAAATLALSSTRGTPRSLVAVDFNRDGRLDLVAPTINETVLDIFYGQP